MNIKVSLAEYKDIEGSRELYRHQAHCQIVHDSVLQRGMAQAYIIEVNGRTGGYAGVWTTHYPKRIMEYYTSPSFREWDQQIYREVIGVTEAVEIEAQTNMPQMLTMLLDFTNLVVDTAVLFEDAVTTKLPCPRGHFRSALQVDASSIFVHQHEPQGDWMVEVDGVVVGTAGAYYHYNPPYGDVYMEVAEPYRRQGFGSYLVQEVKRVCYEAGKEPSARCNPANHASRSTLQKAGFRPCGRLLVGQVVPGK